MKQFNKTLLVLVIVLVSVNTYNILFINKLKKMYSSETSYLKEINRLDSLALKTFVENQILLSENTNFSISPTLKLTGENNSELRLSEITNSNYTLIFRYNEFTCSDCIYKEMGNLKELAKKIGTQNIIILASYKNQRDLYVTKRVNEINLPVYNIPHNSLDNIIDSYNIPYMFIIDKDLGPHNLFIPNRYFISSTEEYFRDILKYFQRTNSNSLEI
ncbi:MAG: hypothetical protein K9H26_19645 [Prolixibacteraceae bacterium]|nr:hypothetical protein [Prolixibacteraceae bacterium]